MEQSFHMTVTAFPDSSLSIEKELQLLKAALLYADKVTFCSPKVVMLSMVISLANISDEDQRLDLLINLSASAGFNRAQISQAIRAYRILRKKQFPTKAERAQVTQLRDGLNSAWQGLEQQYEKMAQEAGLYGLITALQTGVVTLQPMQQITSTDSFTQEYFEIAGKNIMSGTTYPLFDASTGALIQAAIREGKLDPSEARVARGKHTALSGEVLQRLPLFEEASVEEVVQIRQELSSPLIHFRKAIMGYSETIKSAAWEENFPLEADHVFRHEIEPAVKAIEEAVESTSYFKILKRKAISSPVLVSSSALSVVLSQLSNLGEMVHLAMPLVSSGELLRLMLQTWQERQDSKEALEQNQLYFYYRTGKMLTELGAE